jgi:crotonobetainyl-CoA:carnitine CoA-transferase CaiB-like acyl-CoA transferase
LPHRPPPDRPRSALGNIYRTSDDRWLQLTIVREDKMWPSVCETIGRPELLDDPRFATVEERRKRSGELAAILSEAFVGRDYEHWRQAMAAHGITFGVISRPQDIPDDEQAVACGAIVGTAIAELPRTLANPIKLGFAEARIAKSAPSLGQHSDEVLAEAGLSGEEIARLRTSGAIR